MSDNAEFLIGMPKSGMNWKKKSTRASSRIKKYHVVSWEEKEKRRKQKKELQEYLKGIKDEQEQERQKEIQRIKDKKKRDELNKYKTADLQLINDAKKIKKWTKKARKSLVKLPAEIFETFLKKRKND
ncbi:hypothetical protein pb186bvf_019624 [Paramecium bursaria]